MFKAFKSNFSTDVKTGVVTINQCHFCEKTAIETEIKRCGACFKASYCSPEHQKMHWRKHKEFCKVLQKVENMLPSGDLSNSENWMNYRKLLAHFCQQEMKRELTTNEAMLITCPGRCEICRSKNAKIICQDCLCVNYCSEKHKHLDSKYHSELCKNLKYMIDTYKYCKECTAPPSYSFR